MASRFSVVVAAIRGWLASYQGWVQQQPRAIRWIASWLSHAILASLFIAPAYLVGAWRGVWIGTSAYYTIREVQQWYDAQDNHDIADRVGDALAPWVINYLVWGVWLGHG